jgi:hypothetical protein
VTFRRIKIKNFNPHTSMPDGKAIVTIKNSSSKPIRKRQTDFKPPSFEVTVQGGKRKNQRRRKTRLNRYGVNMENDTRRTLVPIPRDTRTIQAPSTAFQTGLGDARNFAKQMIAPHMTGQIDRAPCLVNFKNHCTKFNKVINFTFGAGGNLNGRFVPQPHFLELANTTDFPLANGELICQSKGENRGRGIMWVHGSEGTARIRPCKVNGVLCYPMNVEVGTEIEITDDSPNTPAGVFTVFEDGGQSSWTPGTGVFTATAAGSFVAFSFDQSTYSEATVRFTTDTHIQAGFVYTPYPVELPADTETLRAILLTGLVTYTGATLNNQGNIVMAVTDPNWVQGGVSLYDQLSSLPDKRFNGPLKKGAYGWWSPATIEEETPQHADYFDIYPNSSAIYFAITGAEEGQTMKIEGNIGIEFNSPQQVFSHIACRPKTPIYDHLYHLFNTLPHVMPNDEHDDVCKGILSRVNKTITAAAANPAALTLGILALA